MVVVVVVMLVVVVGECADQDTASCNIVSWRTKQVFMSKVE